MFFESNGVPRVVEVVDTTAADSAGAKATKAAREKANPTDDGSVGAPMAGEVIDIKIKPGARRSLSVPVGFVAILVKRVGGHAAARHILQRAMRALLPAPGCG